DQCRGQGNGRNENGDAINENNDRKGFTYKEFLACNPKEYDGKGGRKVSIGMSWDNFKVLMREWFCHSNEMQKLETKLWNRTMARADHAAYTDRFHELARLVPRNVNLINARNATVRACYKCGSTNQVKGHRNNGNQVRGRAFMIGSEEACKDPNIVMGIDPSDLRFSYEIKIASRQLVETNKAIKGCKLEIEGHVFDINLIPFRSESFDMIIGMDWLSNHKAEIICHEKGVRIPLPDDKVLKVIRERPKEKMRHLRSAKTKEQKQEEIVVVRDYPEGDVRTLIMNEAYKSKYFVHPRADKMYYDLKDRYWWPRIKKDIAVYEGIAMDFVKKLPRTSSGHDTIWVIVDRLTKSAHFLPMREDYKMDRLVMTYPPL
nr:hypothetical protein [Tanacetum cinerariifolium]